MASLGGLGRPSLIVALVFAAAAMLLLAAGGAMRRKDLSAAGRRALVAAAAFVGLAAVALVSALLAHDFSFEYVASYSSTSLSRGYTLAALWGGMEGSLLFWTALLMLFSVVALSRARALDASSVSRSPLHSRWGRSSPGTSMIRGSRTRGDGPCSRGARCPSGSCSAGRGPTRSWVGAATGRGTRLKTRRSCPGSPRPHICTR